MIAGGGEIVESLFRSIEVCGVVRAAPPAVDNVRRFSCAGIRQRVETWGGDAANCFAIAPLCEARVRQVPWACDQKTYQG